MITMKLVLTTFFLIASIGYAPSLYAETDCESHADHPTQIVSEVPT